MVLKYVDRKEEKMTDKVLQKNADDTWSEAIPLPYYYGLFPWLWKRLTGWRDEYGRKAHLFWEWPNY